MTSGDWRRGEGRSACFKQMPSRKGAEWDNEVCSSVPLAHDEVRPQKASFGGKELQTSV